MCILLGRPPKILPLAGFVPVVHRTQGVETGRPTPYLSYTRFSQIIHVWLHDNACMHTLVHNDRLLRTIINKKTHTFEEDVQFKGRGVLIQESTLHGWSGISSLFQSHDLPPDSSRKATTEGRPRPRSDHVGLEDSRCAPRVAPEMLDDLYLRL